MPKKPAKVIKRKPKEVKLATRHSAKLKKKINMKGCIWNRDGFGDSAKHSFVHETIREHKLNFFFLLF
jgi:hypothetical protein